MLNVLTYVLDLFDVTANDVEGTSKVLDIDMMNVFQQMPGI